MQLSAVTVIKQQTNLNVYLLCFLVIVKWRDSCVERHIVIILYLNKYVFLLFFTNNNVRVDLNVTIQLFFKNIIYRAKSIKSVPSTPEQPSMDESLWLLILLQIF